MTMSDEQTPRDRIQFVMAICGALQTAGASLFIDAEARAELNDEETGCLHTLMHLARATEDSLESIDKRLGYERPVGFRKREREKPSFKTGDEAVHGSGVFFEEETDPELQEANQALVEVAANIRKKRKGNLKKANKAMRKAWELLSTHEKPALSGD